MIECRNLTKSYGELEAVSDFSLHLEEHEFISILGPSGCGKSTLLRLIAGLEVPSRGQVLLEKREISGEKIILPPERRKFGMIFQDFALFPHLSIEKNIAYGVNGSRSEKQKRVVELLKLVSLQHLASKMPHQISGGEQQRIAVARSLAPRPRLILMDEPFSALDLISIDMVKKIILALTLMVSFLNADVYEQNCVKCHKALHVEIQKYFYDYFITVKSHYFFFISLSCSLTNSI